MLSDWKASGMGREGEKLTTEQIMCTPYSETPQGFEIQFAVCITPSLSGTLPSPSLFEQRLSSPLSQQHYLRSLTK
jgi:hypothetical protein